MTAHAAELTEAHSQIFNTFRVHVNLLVILYTDFSFYECKLIFTSVFCCFISLILFLYDRKNLSHAADICLQFLFAIYKSRLHHGHQGLQVEHDREREREKKKSIISYLKPHYITIEWLCEPAHQSQSIKRFAAR